MKIQVIKFFTKLLSTYEVSSMESVYVILLFHFAYFMYLLQQDETGCSDSPRETEITFSDETRDSYSEVHVEEMETKDSSSNNNELPKVHL
jgi:hypothetical protein